MSLQSRLVAAVAFALALGLAFGCALAGWHAGRSVRAELVAALDSGAQAVRAGLDEAARSRDPGADVLRLVGTFDGSRHVRAALLDEKGREVAQSRPLSPAAKVPRWFRGLIAPDLAPVDLAPGDGSPGGIAVRLRADPANELGEVWGWFRDVALMLAVSCGVASLLVSWTVSRALRPIARFRSGLARVESGDFAARVAGDGPPELAALADGFNRMAARLAAVQLQNARLNEQLTTLQEEERADLARDLHDEIGPSLFAVNITAATIQQLAAAGRTAEIAGQARAIQEIVAHLQRCVRDILGRLCPLRAVEPGLRPAVETLVAFWRGRCPGIAFDVAISADETRLGEALKETVYRVVQEGLTNAVRHGQPGRIEVVITSGPDSIVVEVSDDGAAARAADDGAMPRALARKPGFGLSGMRERVMALDGTLSVEARVQDSGVESRGPPALAKPGPAMRILLVDDHSIVRAGLRGLLATVGNAEIHEAADGRAALALVRSVRPHLIVLDLNLPGVSGLELLRRVLLEDKAARVLVLSMHAEPLYAARAMEAGAKGYLSKNASPGELVLAVRRVAEGGHYIENEIAQELALQTVSPGAALPQLTAREVEILRLLADGRSLTEIADALAIGYKTVANACTGIKEKLGVSRMADLIRYAIEIGAAA